MPTIEYMYLSGIFLAALVFAATYFHNQVGLITLLIVGLLCAQDAETLNAVDATIKETGQLHVAHWNYSSRMTFVLSVILFFTAIIIKRRRKRKLNQQRK
jgi:predicted membrane protein